MPFEQTIMPQYRDADPDGLIGLKGAMHYFQDIHTWFMHSMDKGNDVLPEKYGSAWLYTRYLVNVSRKIDYTDTARLSAWMEPYRRPVLVNIDCLLRQHGEIAARGRIENCVFSLTRQRPLRLTDVEFPENVPEEIPNDIPAFHRPDRSMDGMTEKYRRVVRYSDLDKSRHMTNLRYIELFQDVFTDAFWRAFNAAEMEICFLSQCREGEELTVLAAEDGAEIRMAAAHADGTPASVAAFRKR